MLFKERVYMVVTLIPKGKLMTYRQVARAIGRPKAVRAVGNALKRNSNIPEIPCHRVVRANGRVGGYVKGEKRKIELLESEGIRIINGKIELKNYLIT